MSDGYLQTDDSMPLDDRIKTVEKRLVLDRANISVHAREFKRRTRVRVTKPSALLFAGGMGFVAREVLLSRKGLGGRIGKSVGSLLSGAASVAKKALIFI